MQSALQLAMFRILLCSHRGSLQCFLTYFWKSKEIGALRPKFPDYIISCDYAITFGLQKFMQPRLTKDIMHLNTSCYLPAAYVYLLCKCQKKSSEDTSDLSELLGIENFEKTLRKLAIFSIRLFEHLIFLEDSNL